MCGVRLLITPQHCGLCDGIQWVVSTFTDHAWEDGYKRMDAANFETSLRALRYGEADEQDVDEIAIRNFLISVILRRTGKVDEADALLDSVIGIQKVELKGQFHDEWMGKPIQLPLCMIFIPSVANL